MNIYRLIKKVKSLPSTSVETPPEEEKTNEDETSVDTE